MAIKTKTYKLTDDERMYIAERELPAENFFQDGELSLKQALNSLKWQLARNYISRITYDHYMESYKGEL